MRYGMIWLSVWTILLAFCGCQSQDENPDWDPSTRYPDWTYDKPVYVEPAVPPQPYETVGQGVPVYYTRSETFFPEHPKGAQEDVRPRTAVWFSDDGGNCWRKNGYFGVGQKFYTFVSDQDGQYWIRFVGPNMGAAEVPPGQPHQIHVVDTIVPQIELQLDPPPYECVSNSCSGEESVQPAQQPSECNSTCRQKELRPHIYRVGDKVMVHWTITDVNLELASIELSTCFARFPHNLVWSRFQGVLPSCGSMEVLIPEEATEQSGMRFRMIAHDKAGNIGLGMSEILQVEPKATRVSTVVAQEAPPRPPPAPAKKPAEKVKSDTVTTPAIMPEPPVTTKPVSAPPAPKKTPPAPSKPTRPRKPAGAPPPPTDLTEPISIETPTASAPTTRTVPPKQPMRLDELPSLPVAKTAPAPRRKTPAPAPKPTPTTAKSIAVKVAPAPAKKERQVLEAKPAPKPIPPKPIDVQPAKKTEPVAKATPKKEPFPPLKPTPPIATPKPATMKLGDIPEKVQQGWPAKGMTLHGGVSRLLNWLPASAKDFQSVDLEFSSTDGKRWTPLASDLQPGQAVMWTVPLVTSKTCRLRIVGRTGRSGQTVLETSEPFTVDAGTWETIDMSGFKMQVPKSK